MEIRSNTLIHALVAVAGLVFAAGACVPEAPDRVTGVTTAPPAPTELRTGEITSRSVELQWSREDEGEASEFRVYRDGERVGSAESASHTDSGLQPATEYEYRVSAVGDDGAESDMSSPATATTEPRPEDDDGGGDDGGGDEGDGDDDGDDDGGDDDGGDDGGGDDEGDDDGDDGEDDDEDEDEDEGDSTPPSRPENLEGEATGPTTVELTWDAAQDSESGIREYNVYRDGERVGSLECSCFTDEGLEADTRYEYRVSAVNGEGLEGEKSSRERVTTERRNDGDDDDDDGDDDGDGDDGDGDDGDDDDGDEDDDGNDDDGDEDDEEDDSPPSAPSDLEAEEDGATRIELEWDAAHDPESGIAEYVIYRKQEERGPPGDGDRGEREIDRTPSTSYVDRGLEPDTEYRYRVSAVNGAGLEGPKSEAEEEETDEEDD